MPVSSPSYFPPNRADGTVVGLTAGTNTTGSRNFLGMKGAGLNSSASDLLIIGDSSGNQGLTAAHIPNGLICLGNRSLAGANLTDVGSGITCVGIGSATHAAGDLSDLIIVGFNTLNNAVLDASGNTANERNVLIGNNILPLFVNNGNLLQDNVLLGTSIFTADSTVQGPMTVTGNTWVGSEAGRFNQLTTGVRQTTVVGAFAANNINSCGTVSRIVVIGDSAGQNLGTSAAADTVIIGSQSGPSMFNNPNCTLVGSNSDCSIDGIANVILGDNIPAIAAARTNACIIIGSGAGSDIALNGTGAQFYVGFNAPAISAAGALLWGLMDVGNLCIGRSSGAQREFAGVGATNTVKLLTGTKGNTNPVSGGYFYVAGANNSLHWVNSAGFDSTLSDAASLLSLALAATGPTALAITGTVANNSITSTGGAVLTNETLTSAAPSVSLGQVGLGSGTAISATAGSNGATPAQVAGYLVINVSGTAQKIPYYNT